MGFRIPNSRDRKAKFGRVRIAFCGWLGRLRKATRRSGARSLSSLSLSHPHQQPFSDSSSTTGFLDIMSSLSRTASESHSSATPPLHALSVNLDTDVDRYQNHHQHHHNSNGVHHNNNNANGRTPSLPGSPLTPTMSTLPPPSHLGAPLLPLTDGGDDRDGTSYGPPQSGVAQVELEGATCLWNDCGRLFHALSPLIDHIHIGKYLRVILFGVVTRG